MSSITISSTITLNLFKLKPSSDKVQLNYIKLSERDVINQYVYELENSYECIAAPQYGNYNNLKSGVYFIYNNQLLPNNERLNYDSVTIDSSSYIMKYIILKAIARKIEKLGSEKILFLPQRWFAYSQVSCCGKVIVSSKPNQLFHIRPCLIVRVEHIPANEKDTLFLLADLKYKRFNTLTLHKVIKILREKDLDIHQINNLLKNHYYSFKENNKSYMILGAKVLEEGFSKAEVLIENKRKIIEAKNIYLNPHPIHTRKFINKILGEKLSNIEKKQRLLGIQRPKEKIFKIIEILKKLFIETKVFPLTISNVQYSLEITPQKIVWGEEA